MADEAAMLVLHVNESSRSWDGSEVDAWAALAVSAVRDWLSLRGAASSITGWDAALVEVAERPAAAVAAAVERLACSGPVAVRLWGTDAPDSGPADEVAHLSRILGAANLILVQDRQQLVRLAGCGTLDPARVVICRPEFGLGAPQGEGLADLRAGLDAEAIRGARTLLMARAPAAVVAETLESGRGLLLSAEEWALDGAPDGRVQWVDAGVDPENLSCQAQGVGRAAAARVRPRVVATTPRWWRRLEEALEALDPQHG